MAMVRIDRMKRNPIELLAPLQQVSLSTASGQRLDVTIQSRASGMFSGDYFDACAIAYDKKGVPVFLVSGVGQTSLSSVFSTIADSLRVQKLGALAKVCDAHGFTLRPMHRTQAEALLKPYGLRLLHATDIVTFFPIHAFDGAPNLAPGELHDKHEAIRVAWRQRMRQYEGGWIVYDPSSDEEGWMLRGALDEIVPATIQHFKELAGEA